MKKLNKKKVQEAIRVIGHLLETNGTTKVFARNKRGKEVDRFSPAACKFCLAGATDVVAVKVLGIGQEDYDTREVFECHVDNVIISTFFDSPISYPGPIGYWDCTNITGRQQIAWALRNHSERA